MDYLVDYMSFKALSLICLFAILFLGCLNKHKERKNQEPDEEILTVVIKRNHLPSEGDIRFYYSLTKNKGEEGIHFIYSIDSVFISADSSWQTIENHKLDERTLNFFYSTSDTLYLTEMGEKLSTLKLKYLLADSLDFKTENKLHRIYCFTSLNKNPHWDESVFFSKDIGYVYIDYKYLNDNEEIISHYGIEKTNLVKLINQIKSSVAG